MEIPGFGQLASTALVAAVGNAITFRNLAAWLGLVPRQHSMGGKTRLLGISKPVLRRLVETMQCVRMDKWDFGPEYFV